MQPPLDSFAEAGRHITAALVSLAACFPELDAARQREIAEVARQLALTRSQLATPPSAATHEPPDDESDDERIERRAAESAARVDVMLDLMGLSAAEQRFSREVGEHLVDLVTDVFRDAVRGGLGFDGACITAAIAVALAIVHDPPDTRPP